jgi:hypothetical protein
MGSKPTDSVYISFSSRHPVEKANEPVRVISAVPGILDSQLIGFEFISKPYIEAIGGAIPWRYEI